MTTGKIRIDKSNISYMLGRRITGIAIKRRKTDVKGVVQQMVKFMFEDGSGFSMLCTGELVGCNQAEAFDLHSLMQRGSNAYQNEFAAITNPDGAGQAVLANVPVVYEI